MSLIQSGQTKRREASLEISKLLGGNEMANKYGFRELATNKINNLEKVNEVLKKEIKELDKSHREDIDEWVKGDKISYETINRLKKENEELVRSEEFQKQYWFSKFLNEQDKNEELKKENEELHKGWKITEIEKIRNK